jgi:hypothetical protein
LIEAKEECWCSDQWVECQEDLALGGREPERPGLFRSRAANPTRFTLPGPYRCRRHPGHNSYIHLSTLPKEHEMGLTESWRVVAGRRGIDSTEALITCRRGWAKWALPRSGDRSRSCCRHTRSSAPGERVQTLCSGGETASGCSLQMPEARSALS